jgi:hypothetical protein
VNPTFTRHIGSGRGGERRRAGLAYAHMTSRAAVRWR